MNNKQQKEKSKRMIRDTRYAIRGYEGFSLMEMLVAIFIFALVMITVVFVFSKIVVAQKKARAIQQNMEDARFAMELMAKTLRTSSVASNDNVTIDVYNFSQDRCVRYRFENNKVRTGFTSPDNPPGGKDGCTNFGGTSLQDMTNNFINNVEFAVQESSINLNPLLSIRGYARISVEICSDPGCPAGSDKQVLQTTVSLRDYNEVNP